MRKRRWHLQLELSWFRRNVRGKNLKSRAARIALSATVYELWRERNLRKFKLKCDLQVQLLGVLK